MLSMKSQISEQQAQHEFAQADTINSLIEANGDRHAKCIPKILRQRLRSDVNLLHVCTQVWKEARYTALRSRIVSFDNASNLRGFLHHNVQRGIDLNDALLSVHLHMYFTQNQDNIYGWATALQRLVHRAKYVENIYISIDIARFSVQMYTDYGHTLRVQLADTIGEIRNMMLVLRKLPLKNVSLTINDRSAYTDLRMVGNSFDVQSKRKQQKWAAELKRALLGHEQGM